MRIARYHRFKKPEAPRYAVNQFIRAPEVRVIDDEGANRGVLPTPEAIALAHERGYDLVEVAPKENPPIAKILDYGQFKYEREREARKQKAHAKQVEVKGVRLSPRIGQHDLETRRAQAIDFMKNGNKIMVDVVLRGRERQHADLAEKIMKDFIASLQTEFPVRIEQPLTRQGGRLQILVARV